MTRDEVLKLAKCAEYLMLTDDRLGRIKYLSCDEAMPAIEWLVSAAVDAEREACAKVCDRHAKAHELASESAPIAEWREISVNQSLGAEACAAAIRARGTK